MTATASKHQLIRRHRGRDEEARPVAFTKNLTQTSSFGANQITCYNRLRHVVLILPLQNKHGQIFF
eukprot:scaffold8031_cov51-Attheya_sp.AAC.1